MSDDPKNDYQRALTALAPVKDNVVSATGVERLKTAFMASQYTLEDFCALYGGGSLPASTLKGIAQRGKWLAERKATREQRSAEARDRLRKEGLEFETKLDRTVHLASKKLVKLISGILTNTTRMLEDSQNQRAVTLDDLPKLRAGIEALNASYALARKTAGLSAEPMPGRDQINLENLSHDEREDLKSLLLKAAGPKRIASGGT